VKLVTITDLIKQGEFPSSAAWTRVERDVRAAIAAVCWPPGADTFTIYAQSGKRRGEGNGVTPVKRGFVTKLTDLGWKLEGNFAKPEADIEPALRPGAFDAWLALLHGRISGGVLILPTRDLARFLTDRVGNYPELAPYFPLWSSLNVRNGYLGVLAVE